MLMKMAVAVSVSLVIPASDDDYVKYTQYPLIHKISCDEGWGTGFRVGLNHWLSVAHVTAMHNCAVDDQKIALTEQNGPRDFSRFDTRVAVPNGMRVNCEGFIPGHWYWAIGHAKALDYQTNIAVFATIAKSSEGFRVLFSPYDVIPGMSGGPVVNDAGEVVGTVNAYFPGFPISLSRELKDTSICGGNIA